MTFFITNPNGVTSKTNFGLRRKFFHLRTDPIMVEHCLSVKQTVSNKSCVLF